MSGASRDRTDGLILAEDALSQLSYSPRSDVAWDERFGRQLALAGRDLQERLVRFELTP